MGEDPAADLPPADLPAADLPAADLVAAGTAALAGGRWSDARQAFEAACRSDETAEACMGLASALWWLGEAAGSVAAWTRAYAGHRRAGDAAGAVTAAVALAIAYKSNFGNQTAAGGWLTRAERLLPDADPGALHGWVRVARAYRLPDLEAAARLSEEALGLAREAGDTDLELVALAQLGHIRVATGDVDGGFALIDEAVAAALAGEGTTFDTVAYTCCDMLVACDLATDFDRAAQWCQLVDGFAASYGCPFLSAECRLCYGGVLATRGRWAEAALELEAAVGISGHGDPGVHARAVGRLARLRTAEGRLEEAEGLLAGVEASVDLDAEATVARAALLLARGEVGAARDLLEATLPRLGPGSTQAVDAAGLLAEAHLALADVDAAAGLAAVLAGPALAPAGDEAAPAAGGDGHLRALAAEIRGRVALASGADGTADLEAAVLEWSRLERPYQAARARAALALALGGRHRDLALDHGRRALDAFERLGARLDADRWAAELRPLGLPARAGPRAGGDLTAREQEVLHLLGLGLSNPDIARRLYISRKTASHHVSAVLRKLGLRSRAEAAAYAAHRAGAAAPP